MESKIYDIDGIDDMSYDLRFEIYDINDIIDDLKDTIKTEYLALDLIESEAKEWNIGGHNPLALVFQFDIIAGIIEDISQDLNKDLDIIKDNEKMGTLDSNILVSYKNGSYLGHIYFWIRNNKLIAVGIRKTQFTEFKGFARIMIDYLMNYAIDMGYDAVIIPTPLRTMIPLFEKLNFDECVVSFKYLENSVFQKEHGVDSSFIYILNKTDDIEYIENLETLEGEVENIDDFWIKIYEINRVNDISDLPEELRFNTSLSHFDYKYMVNINLDRH